MDCYRPIPVSNVYTNSRQSNVFIRLTFVEIVYKFQSNNAGPLTRCCYKF